MSSSKITSEVLAKLVAIALANGVDLGVAPEGSDIADSPPVMPAVNLNRAVSEIAHETGLNLKTSGLYIYDGRLITVGEDGKEEVMDDLRFRTWIDQFQLNFYKRKKTDDDDAQGAPIKTTLKADVSKVMLRSDDLLGHLPIIKRIMPVRLPVWQHDDAGTPGLRLLPYGYDAETQVYTKNTGIQYAGDWPLETAVTYLRELLKDYPFGDDGRSLAVQVCAMLTMFCRFLIGELDRSPLFYFNANQPGSGKSRLGEICIYPLYGNADPLTYSDNDEFTKKLDTWAQSNELYAFLDDVSGLVKNNDLNRWITSPTWSGRVMHSQRAFSVHNPKLTLLTGNQAPLSEDLTRRALMVDLWSAELATERQNRFERVIDAQWLATPKNRCDILSALSSLVSHWVAAGAKPNEKQLPSFEGWSRVVPAIVRAAGFACPLAPANVKDAGGKQQVEFLKLIEAAVCEYTPEEGMQIGKPIAILLTDWCRLARRCGLFHGVLSDIVTTREVLDQTPRLYKPVCDQHGAPRDLTESDKDNQASRYMEKGQATKFGGLLNKFYRGQIRTINGRRYKFADREAKFSTFTLELLDDERPESEPF